MESTNLCSIVTSERDMNAGDSLFPALYPEIGFSIGTEARPTLDFHYEFVPKWSQGRLIKGFAPFVVLNINPYVVQHIRFPPA
jgi:hypothetical protein